MSPIKCKPGAWENITLGMDMSVKTIKLEKKNDTDVLTNQLVKFGRHILTPQALN